MSDQYPLTKSLGLEVISVNQSETKYVRALHLEEMLAKGVRVSGPSRESCMGTWNMTEMICGQGKPKDTHSALLINIQPIVKDTAESLLRELLDFGLHTDSIGLHDELCELKERARKLIGDK